MGAFDLDIVSTVRSYGIALKQQGKLYVGLCPFHNDKNNPNLVVYPDTNSFFCFSCRTGGDVIRFIALIEGVSMDEIRCRFKDIVLHKKLEALNKPQAVDFKTETYFLISNLVREYLKKHYDQLPKALAALQKIDDKLDRVESISYKSGKALVEKLKHHLYNI